MSNDKVREEFEARSPAVQGEPSLVAWVLYDATADQKYIKMHSDGSLAIFDSEAAARRAKFLHPGTDYKRCEYYSVPQPANCAGCEGKPEPENTPCAVCGLHLVPPAPEETLSVADYEEVLDDHRRLARELDELLNGKEGAAKQASLCDLVAQLRALVRNTGRPVLSVPDVSGLVEAQPTERLPIRHDWDDQDKCRRCGDRDWYAGPICTPKQPADLVEPNK